MSSHHQVARFKNSGWQTTDPFADPSIYPAIMTMTRNSLSNLIRLTFLTSLCVHSNPHCVQLLHRLFGISPLSQRTRYTQEPVSDIDIFQTHTRPTLFSLADITSTWYTALLVLWWVLWPRRFSYGCCSITVKARRTGGSWCWCRIEMVNALPLTEEWLK